MCYTLDEIKEKTIPIAISYGIKSMTIFGSYARGEANDESDVDIIIDKGQVQSLIRYFMFVEELEKSLGCHVDVVTTSIEDKNFLSKIQEEGVLLYEE
ncbi:nucleotidyltransferase family protein [Butyrivibrio sp. AE3006]|uniref:nucleotidyltransferase family protein n=1 Tax=Butyrivibrio sp. AE3006 TaxID=1280673 RepID=UPI0003FD0256|nr:nucleotidyltransferase domain-containing protein [Butyrivibrio sp. AE3006]